jgi:hypothetical protein
MQYYYIDLEFMVAFQRRLIGVGVIGDFRQINFCGANLRSSIPSKNAFKPTTMHHSYLLTSHPGNGTPPDAERLRF